MSRKFIVVYVLAVHLALFAALGAIGVLFGAGARFNTPSVTHEFIADHNAEKWGQGWVEIYAGSGANQQYGRLRDASGEVFLIYIAGEDGLVRSIEVMPLGASSQWSFIGKSGSPWKSAIWDLRTPDYDRTMGAPIFDFSRYNDDNGDGMPDRLVEKNGSTEPYLRYRLADEPWALVED